MVSEAKAVRFESSRFGVIDIRDKNIIHMSKGLYGFSESNRFVIVEHQESSPFKWLQSIDCPELAFVIVDPSNFFPGYKVDLNQEDKLELHVEEEDYMVSYVTVVIPPDPRHMTANMLGPIVINSDKMLAKQVVLMDERYTTRQLLIEKGC